MKITMVEAALKYTELNIPVMPLHWIYEDGSCSCKAGRNCNSKGKHPLYSGWYKDSTTDTHQIKKWWTETPYANIGVPTGEKFGWLVLDVDEGGDETLSELETIHGKLPETITAITGSGGRHYIFKYPKGKSIPNRTKFAPGLDTRSSGGLIVVSPSLHISGNRYKWIEGHNPANMKLVEDGKTIKFPYLTVYYKYQAYAEAISLFKALGGSAKYNKKTVHLPVNMTATCLL